MAGNGIDSSLLKSSSYTVDFAFGNQEYVSLISGYQWGNKGESVKISYSFPGQSGMPASHAGFYSSADEWTAGWSALNSTQMQNVRLAIAEWEEASSIDFYEVPDNQQQAGDIRFAFSKAVPDNNWGYAFYPGLNASGGDIWINDEHISDSFAPGTYEFISTMHEIGHAIGLKHPHDTGTLNSRKMSESVDDIHSTVMSYDQAGLYVGSNWPSEVGRFDEQAIDTIYGLKSVVADGVHRFFNTNTGGHFFTISDFERDQVVATIPYLRPEGTGFGGFATDQGAATEEVYRFFNTKTGGHFFTTSEYERDQVIATDQVYKLEGVGFYDFTTDQGAATEEVYRFFNTKTGGHFFTASETERDQVIATDQIYRFEGIAFYAPQDGATLML